MPVKPTAAVALDIGNANLKIVQTTADGRLAKFAVHKLPEGCLEDLSIVYDDALIKSLKTARKKSHHSSGKCTLVLSGSDIIIRHLTLPILPEEELYQNIVNEMSGYLPVSPDKYHIDYKIAGTVKEDDIEMYKVLVSTAHKRMIDNFRKVLSKAGLSLSIVDTCENAREKLLKYNQQCGNIPGEGGICIIDIGSKSTRVSIYHNGDYYVSNNIRRSGQTITEAISKKTGKDILASEATKREANLLIGQHPNSQMQSAVVNEVDAMLHEVVRVLDYYKSRNKTPITAAFLAGGGALLPGLEEYMQEHLEIPVRNAAALFAAANKKAVSRGFAFLLNAYAATFREDQK